MPYTYPITIQHIFISLGHNYFGRPKDGPGSHLTQDVAQVEARAGRGLVGDRYFGVPAHYEAQVTFFAAEVFAALQAELGLDGLSPILTRRNIVTAGANLNQLIGHEFELDCDGDRVRFLGTKPCSPCAWMDAMLRGPSGRSAHAFLRGRGGLRARILTDGLIRRGPATLISDRPLDDATIAAPLAKPNLP